MCIRDSNNPVHITRWDGSFEPGVKGVITLVYDPNGGEGAAVTEQQLSLIHILPMLWGRDGKAPDCFVLVGGLLTK